MSTQLCTFQLDRMLFGVAATEVQEIARPQPITRVPLAHPAIAGLLNLRGQIVTTIDLRARLGLPPRAPTERPFNVVVRSGDGVFSLLVDAIGDVLEPRADELDVVPETVPSSLRDLISGTYKLPDQFLFVLILDLLVWLPA
jgi:purine-binding chemotaxis protein CheW